MQIAELVNWALKNRRGGFFKDWPEDDVRQEILNAVAEKRIIVDVNEKDEILGMTIYELRLHISQMLTIKKGSAAKMAQVFRKSFSTVQAMRDGKLITYPLSRAIQLLNK